MGFPKRFHKQHKKGFIPQAEKKRAQKKSKEQRDFEKAQMRMGQVGLWTMTPKTTMPVISMSTGVVLSIGPHGGVMWSNVPDYEEEISLEPQIEETETSKQVKQQIMQLKEVLNHKFVNVNEVAEILEIGHVTKKNVFLYGRGGHAKSEIIQEFLKHVDSTGENSFVQACGEGLTEEKLFGGLNLAKFQKTGEIEYLVENSFMNKKYVVFEELLDSRMNVLLSLKDILTSGIFRQGSQQFKIKTEFVVCLTNRTKQEVAEDNSIKALMERFPLEMKVEWPSYNSTDYSAMFNKVLKNPLSEIATICESINENGDFVSPRTAIHMAQVYLSTRSINNLKYFGATKEVIERVEKMNRERAEMQIIERSKNDFNTYIGGVKPIDLSDYKRVMKEVKNKLILLNSRSYCDKNFGEYTAVRTAMEGKIKAYQSEALKLLEND